VCEIDDFTGELKKTTKTMVFVEGTYKEVYMELIRVEGKFELRINIFSSSLSAADPINFTATRGSSLWIKFSDGEVMKLPLATEICQTRDENTDLMTEAVLGVWANLSKKNRFIFSPTYQISGQQVAFLADRKVEKIRVEAQGYHAYTKVPVENMDIELTPEFQEDLFINANCILSEELGEVLWTEDGRQLKPSRRKNR
jgi:hypothetical protein